MLVEHPVDAEPEELDIFSHRVESVVGREKHRPVAERVGMDHEPGLVSVGHQAGVWQESSITIRRHDAALVGPDAAGIGGDFGKPSRRHHVAVGAWVVGNDEVVRPRSAPVEQLHEPQFGHLTQIFEAADLERLNEYRRMGAAIVIGFQRLDQPRLEILEELTYAAPISGATIRNAVTAVARRALKPDGVTPGNFLGYKETRYDSDASGHPLALGQVRAAAVDHQVPPA